MWTHVVGVNGFTHNSHITTLPLSVWTRWSSRYKGNWILKHMEFLKGGMIFFLVNMLGDIPMYNLGHLKWYGRGWNMPSQQKTEISHEVAIYKGNMVKSPKQIHFLPGIRGMIKNDLPYLIGNFARIPKMLLKFSQKLFFIVLWRHNDVIFAIFAIFWV